MGLLRDYLISEIGRNGKITFARFVELALYHEQYGYYSSGKAQIGREGDFYTSPCVHSSFGEVIAGFINRTREVLSEDEFKVVELGSSKGMLATDILDAISVYFPQAYNDIEYILIDRGLKATDEQTGLTDRHGEKVSCLSDISQLSEGIKGVFISNELFDSLPFHRLRKTANGISEIYVGFNGDGFTDIQDEPSTDQLQQYIDRYDIEFHEGQEFEVCLSAGSILESILSRLDTGLVLTIDYGYLHDELYSPARPRGTYKCHYRHTLNEDPYSNIGEQDITYHVDFSNLILTGKESGIDEYIFRNQGQFLIDWGILDIAERYSPVSADEDTGVSDRLAIKNLILPQLMGKVFKVLLQFKGTDSKHTEKLKVSAGFKLV